MTGKFRSITLLLIAEVAAMSLWFVSAAILPGMLSEVAMPPIRQAALSSAVQLGFVAGAVTSAVLGLADRFDPRRVFFLSALAAAAANLALVRMVPGSDLSILMRFLTGTFLAGVYPLGMKIAVGWGEKDRGFLVGAVVGALTLGTALPHLFALAGGTEWRWTVTAASVAAGLGGLLILLTGLGPFHARAPRFDPTVIRLAWTNRRVRYAYGGYLGHMWELFAMWAWVGIATTASYSMRMPADQAARFGTITAFLTIGVGAITSILAGRVADRIGKAEVAALAMLASGACAILTGLSFGGPVWLIFALVMIWGMAVIPDSAQFSALVADAVPADQAGSLMTLQTALGFLLTFVTVQILPGMAAALGWPLVLASLALGPVFGIWCMLRHRAEDHSRDRV